MELELKHKDILPYLDKGIKFHLPIESDRFDSIIEHEPFRLALPFMEQEEQDKYLEKYKGMYLFQKEPFIANEDGRIFLGEMQCSLGFEEDDVFLDEVLPILEPISNLTKHITRNGVTFVAIEWFEDKYYTLDFHKQCLRLLEEDGENWINQCDYMLVEQLIEWKFDVFGLIDKGLAVECTNEYN